MKRKSLDCVEMKRRGARILQEKLDGMTREQQIAFWVERSKELREHLEAARRRGKTP